MFSSLCGPAKLGLTYTGSMCVIRRWNTVKEGVRFKTVSVTAEATMSCVCKGQIYVNSLYYALTLYKYGIHANDNLKKGTFFLYVRIIYLVYIIKINTKRYVVQYYKSRVANEIGTSTSSHYIYMFTYL